MGELGALGPVGSNQTIRRNQTQAISQQRPLGFLQSFHMILGQLPLRAKPSHVEAEPGGSRGTVVIVRTRVGFGVSLVGGGARVQVFERSICAPNGHFWRLLRYP